MQYLPSTWKAHSTAVYGEVRAKTPEREWYVAVTMIEKWLEAGHDERAISRLWNQGNTGPCVRGTNTHGVKYDSCAYQEAIMNNIRNNQLALLQ